MFAGKFAAGAGAFKSDIADIYLCLVRLAAAALCLAPNGLRIGALAYPFRRVGKFFSRFFGSFVGRQG